jgi:hypothetical protein
MTKWHFTIHKRNKDETKCVPSVGISIRSLGGAEFFTSLSKVNELSSPVLFLIKLDPASSNSTSPAETKRSTHEFVAKFSEKAEHLCGAKSFGKR